jgi:hypothetical protein
MNIDEAFKENRNCNDGFVKNLKKMFNENI